MPNFTQARGTRFNNASAAGSGSASVNRVASTGRIYYITDISGSTDQASGTTTIRLFSEATNTLWQDTFVRSYTKSFDSEISVSAGSAISLNVSNNNTAGTAYANFSGYFIG